MHPSVILLVDLHERPESKEAPVSRALIDELFSMSGPDTLLGGDGEAGVAAASLQCDGGHEEWNMLRRLRERAWNKAGLDPDVFWNEEDQLKASASRPSELLFGHARMSEPPQMQKESLSGESSLQSLRARPGPPWQGVEDNIPSYSTSDTVPLAPSATYNELPLAVPPFVQSFGSAPNTNSFGIDIDNSRDLRTTWTQVGDAFQHSGENYEPRFDWTEWDAVFGQRISIDNSIASMEWEGTETCWSDSLQRQGDGSFTMPEAELACIEACL